MLTMTSDSTRIRRRDVRIDDVVLDRFVRKIRSTGIPVTEILMNIELYVERNGTVVAECPVFDGETVHCTIFGTHEWEISDDADDLTRRVLEKVRPKPSPGGVFDIFTGRQLGS
jgi:hypothetical protein